MGFTTITQSLNIFSCGKLSGCDEYAQQDGGLCCSGNFYSVHYGIMDYLCFIIHVFKNNKHRIYLMIIRK